MFKTTTQKQPPSASSPPSSASNIPNSAKLILAVGFLFAAGYYASSQISIAGSGLIIVIAAVIGLVKPGRLLRMAQISPADAVVAWITFCATLALSPRVEQGVLVGILVSLAVGLRRRRR